MINTIQYSVSSSVLNSAIMSCRFGVVLILSVLLSVQADDTEKSDPRIVGGYKVTDRSQFPYQVSLQMRRKHFCGGSILNENHVLTAAHCCYDDEQKLFPVKHLTVVVGGLNLLQVSRYTVKKNVKYTFPHSKYNSRTQSNDIAVIRIDGTFGNWNSMVQPLKLAESLPPPPRMCRVSGWGKLHFEDDYIPSDLYAADIFTYDQEKCKNAYRNKIKTGMFCAGTLEGGIDSCQGDSGGPLEYNNTLLGVVSWGNGCALKGFPGVYTDVSYYSDWVSAQQTRSSAVIYVISTLSIVTAMILHLLRFQ